MSVRVFISHNSRDNDAVRDLSSGLARRGITTVVDDEQRPHVSGVTSWIEEMMADADATIVAIGPHGVGGWQRAEIDVAIALQIEHGQRVVNVLLPGAKDTSGLPVLLKRYPWEAFANGIADDAALDRLAFVLTGRRAMSTHDGRPARPVSAAPVPEAGGPVAAAVSYLANTIEKGRNTTFFVGSRDAGAPGDADTAALSWDLTRDLLVEIGILNEQDECKVLPPLDAAGAYYAYHRGIDVLEGTLHERSGRRFGASVADRALARLLAQLAGRRADGGQADVTIAAPRPQLIVTTRRDLALERALLEHSLCFTRVVQCRDGARVETSYGDVQLMPGGVSLAAGTGRSRTRFSARAPADLDAAISHPDAATRVRPGANLSLARAERIVLYKYHGSQDVDNSGALTTDHLFDTAKAVKVPQAITEIVMNTPSLLLGFSMLDTDFRHLYHAVLADLFDHRIAPYERFSVQLAPSLEPDDPSRALEAPVWDSIKRRASSVLGITVLEDRADAFLERLMDAALPVLSRRPV